MSAQGAEILNNIIKNCKTPTLMNAQGAEILNNIIKKLQTLIPISARALRFTSAPSPSSLKFSNKKIRISKLRSMPPSPSESAKKFISNGDALHAKAKTDYLVSLPSGLKSEALDLRNENTPLLLSSASASASGSSVFINITNGNGSSHNNRRRRVASDGDIPSLAHSRRHSFRNDVGHAAAETYLVTRLSFQLLRYLGIGYRWITKFLALGLYAACLLPGFIQIGYYYYFSKCVRRSVVYGKEPRNRLDLYIPEDTNEPKPVVAFVTGGAWIIGYKAWGALLAQELVERGVIVACVDYRNFPQGTVSDMVNDASEGISFVCKNIAEYGGDPDRIYLVGQSAGAHIAACVLVDQAHKEVLPERKELSWTVSQIKAYFGISGGYNLLTLVEHFHRRGLYRSIFLGIMEGEQSLASFSPELVVQTASFKDAISLLPPIVLLHGTGDYSIPSEASTNFADSLRSVGAKVEVILYEGKTHTDIFLQDPMRGGKDQVIEDILSFIHAGDPAAQAVDANRPPRRRLVPEFLLRLATKLSPF